MKRSTETRKPKTSRNEAKSRARQSRATMSEAESSDLAPRKRYTRKDEPENHTRLQTGKKGHVTY